MRFMEIKSNRYDLFSMEENSEQTRALIVFSREDLPSLDMEKLCYMGMESDAADKVLEIKNEMLSEDSNNNGVCIAIGECCNLILLGSDDPRVFYHELGHFFHHMVDERTFEYTRRAESFADVFSTIAILSKTKCRENAEYIIDYRDKFKYSSGYWSSNALRIVIDEYDVDGDTWEEDINFWYNKTCEIMSKYLNPSFKDIFSKKYLMSKMRYYKHLMKHR